MRWEMFTGFWPSKDAGIQAIFAGFQEESLPPQPLGPTQRLPVVASGHASDLMSSPDCQHQVLYKCLSPASLPCNTRAHQPLEPVPHPQHIVRFLFWGVGEGINPVPFSLTLEFLVWCGVGWGRVREDWAAVLRLASRVIWETGTFISLHLRFLIYFPRGGMGRSVFPEFHSL